MSLDLANVINVTVSGMPQGLSDFNINTMAIFTHETPNFIEDGQIYLNAREVEEAFGTSSLTAKMAEAIFAQSPNILSGGGYLAVIPMQNASSATFGNFVTADIHANIANFAAVTNGEFKITLNGIAHNITGLDFSNINTTSATTVLADVAAVIKKKLLDVFITSNATSITFTSKLPGGDSSIAFAAVSGGTGTDLTGATFLSTSTGTATGGVDSSGETLIEAIQRTEEQIYYTGVLSTLIIEGDVVEDIADAIQSRDKVYFHPVFTSESVAGLGTTIADASQDKTRILLYTDSVEEGRLFAAAYASKALSTNWDGSNTTQTMNLKSLANISSDSGITQTIKTACIAAGVDLYVNYGGLACVVSNGGNDYMDNVIMDIWLKLALQVAGFNYLRQTNTKVPQTEPGMDGLKGAYEQVLVQGVTNAAIGLGLIWNSSETFGNPEDFRRNITDKGYYIYSLPVARQSQQDRSDRKAPLCQIAIKRAGAIHSSDVIVVVED